MDKIILFHGSPDKIINPVLAEEKISMITVKGFILLKVSSLPVNGLYVDRMI